MKICVFSFDFCTFKACVLRFSRRKFKRESASLISVFLLKRITVTLIFLIQGCMSSGPTNTDLATVHFKVGTSHLEKGNFPEALRELLQAEALNPRDPLIHNNLGLAYFMRERFELSETHFLKAVALDSTFTDAKNNLARVYIEKGSYDTARKYLDEVLADLTYTQPGKALVNYGLSYFRQDKFNQAKDAFLKAIGHERENCLAQNYYGRSLLELKDSAKAINALDKATGFCLKVNFDEPIYFSAIAYYRVGDKIKAQARLESLVQKNSSYKDKAETMLEILRK